MSFLMESPVGRIQCHVESHGTFPWDVLCAMGSNPRCITLMGRPMGRVQSHITSYRSFPWDVFGPMGHSAYVA